jgi:transcriptional regulator with XRE-family HTH domain
MFDQRIKELRQSLGINQVEFGRRINVSKQCVCNWENGNIQPSIDMLVRIANTFSISADYLLGLSDTSTIDVSGLTSEQIMHIRNIVVDMRTLMENG